MMFFPAQTVSLWTTFLTALFVGMDDHEAATRHRPAMISGTDCVDAVKSPCRGRFERLLEAWPFDKQPPASSVHLLRIHMDAARGQEVVSVTNRCDHEGQPCPVESLDMHLPADAGWADIPTLAEFIAPKMAVMAQWFEAAPHVPDLEPEANFVVHFLASRGVEYGHRDWAKANFTELFNWRKVDLTELLKGKGVGDGLLVPAQSPSLVSSVRIHGSDYYWDMMMLAAVKAVIPPEY
jgi:hypothetical protein